jgi:hypothetical protein
VGFAPLFDDPREFRTGSLHAMSNTRKYRKAKSHFKKTGANDFSAFSQCGIFEYLLLVIGS